MIDSDVYMVSLIEAMAELKGRANQCTADINVLERCVKAFMVRHSEPKMSKKTRREFRRLQTQAASLRSLRHGLNQEVEQMNVAVQALEAEMVEGNARLRAALKDLKGEDDGSV